MEHKDDSPRVQSIRELVISRIVHAPRDLLFTAWTDPKRLARWWGPSGFTNPVCELDLRSDGRIRIDMCGPDGVLRPMKGVFHEITPPERLVFTSSAYEEQEGKPQLEVLNTVTFSDLGDKTMLVLKAVVVKATPPVASALAGMEQGWSQSLDRLEEFAAEDASAAQGLVARWQACAPRLRSLLRIASAVIFILAGTMKLFGFPPPPNGSTVQLVSELGLAGILETFGGALLLLGLFTRPVAFVVAGEMAVAYFQVHFPRGIWPTLNGGLGAVLYCFIWLYFSAAGAGPWSLDAKRGE